MALKGFFECPRCNGTDIYVAKRQRVVGTSVQMVDTPLCRACGETANWVEIPLTKEEYKRKFRLQVGLILFFGLLLFIVVANFG